MLIHMQRLLLQILSEQISLVFIVPLSVLIMEGEPSVIMFLWGVAYTIIVNVHIVNNVTIVAGSVVVKNLPDNCVAVGNPAKVVKMRI